MHLKKQLVHHLDSIEKRWKNLITSQSKGYISNYRNQEVVNLSLTLWKGLIFFRTALHFCEALDPLCGVFWWIIGTRPMPQMLKLYSRVSRRVTSGPHTSSKQQHQRQRGPTVFFVLSLVTFSHSRATKDKKNVRKKSRSRATSCIVVGYGSRLFCAKSI